MTPEAEAKRDEAIAFLVDHEAGVLATVARSGEPHARLLYYACDDAFNVYFITLKSTRKVADIASNPHAAFVVSEMDMPRTLQMEGTVTDLTDTAVIDPLLINFVHKLMNGKRYGIPLAHFDGSELKFYRFSPHWVRWGDFTFGQGTDKVLTLIDPSEPPV
jgi:uncharacterized pyridoxamine 5'-phosphate oxidase family protein